MDTALASLLQQHKLRFHPVVKIDAEREKILPLNFTSANTEITEALIADTEKFSVYINRVLKDAKADFGIGGYNEDRPMYKRSKLFAGEYARSLHLGVDIWGAQGTPVYAPLGGMVHSFAFNNHYGDYGATIILQHQLETAAFYTLYGHLALKDLSEMRKGKFVTRGEMIGHFGSPAENGDWPPHLHFQVIEDIGYYEGDYPGVCSVHDSAKYLSNCPDANLMLNF